MDSARIVIDDALGKVAGYHFREVLSNVAEAFESEDECITAIGSFEANLYVGTSKGKILHYHLFEDAPNYILISQLPISNDPVIKVIILPQTQRVLLLAGSIGTLYSLPELTPLHIGKIRDANDISLLSYSVHAANQSRTPIQNDKIIAFTPQKIRILQVGTDQIKLLKDVPYSKAIKGISTASAMSSNYSNLVLVANDTNYDIIDLKHTRKIPLFEYCNDRNRKVEPYIIPFDAQDKSEEEYLLTISSDDSTSMSMFINPLGDVTRGTITWVEEGYPTGGVAIEWPYVLGLFGSQEGSDKVVVSSLESFEVIASAFIGPEKDMVLADEESGTALNIATSSPKPSLPKDTNAEEKESLSRLEHDSPVKEPVTNENKKDANIMPEEKGGDPKIVSETALDSEDGTSSKSPYHEPSSSAAKQDTNTRYGSLRLCKVSQLSLDDESLNRYLGKINLMTKQIENPSKSEKDEGSILIYNNSTVWLTTKLKQLDGVITSFREAVENQSLNEFSETLQAVVDSFSGLQHDFVLHLIILCNFKSGKHKDSLSLLTRLKGGNTVVSPLFVINLLSSVKVEGSLDFLVFKGIYDLCAAVNVEKNDSFISNYFDEIYPDLVKNDLEAFHVIREIKFSQIHELEEAGKFIREKDLENWKELSTNNDRIIHILKRNLLSPVLIIIYEHLISVRDLQSPGIVENYLEICLEVLRGKTEILKTIHLTKDRIIENALTQLQKNVHDENIYSKYLLEISKIDSEQAFCYLKNHKNSKFKSTHRRIMEELSHSHTDELSFSLLRIEYLEGSWIDSNYNCEESKELISELIKTSISSNVLTEENKVNFEILSTTYKLENSLQESKWPKIGWIDYIHLNLNRSEAKELLKLYVKIFEVLFYMKTRDWDFVTHLNQLTTNSGNVFDYLAYLKHEESTVSKLLEFHDFSSAEYNAIHDSLPFSKQTIYFKEALPFEVDSPVLSKGSVKSNLQKILDFYISQEQNDALNISCVQHFACSYGHDIFTPSEMLNLLPQEIPLVHLLRYLEGVIIDLKAQNRESLVKKTMSKADSSLMGRIYKDISS